MDFAAYLNIVYMGEASLKAHHKGKSHAKNEKRHRAEMKCVASDFFSPNKKIKLP